MEDDRPVTAFYHETENRSENGEDVIEKRAGSERTKKQSKKKEDGGRPAVSEPQVQPEKENSDSSKEGQNDQSKMEGEENLKEVNDDKAEATSKADEQKNPEDCLTAGCGEDPSSKEQTDDHLPKEEPPEAAASNAAARAPEEPPDVSDMMRFSMDSPGGACVVSLGLMSLGLLSVYMSIPKQMVVVDSNLVDNDVVKK